MHTLIFICLGNICRSPSAEFVFKSLIAHTPLETEWNVISRATAKKASGEDVYPDAKAELIKHHIPLAPRRSQVITQAEADQADLIIAMDKQNILCLSHRVRLDDPSKVRLLLSYANRPNGEVADPYFTRDFAKAYQDILAGCQGLKNALLKAEGL